MFHTDRPASQIDLSRMDRDAMIAVARGLWAGFYLCPTTGRVLCSLPGDDKVLCRCGRSNPRLPHERTERTGVHLIAALEPTTVYVLVDQELDDWRRRATR